MESPAFDVSPDNGSSRGRSQGRHKKRIRVWTEDDRAKHRVFEKGRREAFSDSLLSLARFLPSLTSVKESKLSKHTIVDESLKYHELQKTKLEDLQKTIDVLKAEKEALLTELSGWRECLDVQPEQPVSAELLGATTAGSNTTLISSHDPNPVFDANTVAGPIAATGISAVPSASYDMLTGPIPPPPPHSQLPDSYIHEAPNVRFRDGSNMGNLPRASHYPIQDSTFNEPAQHSLWQPQEIPHMQQPLWTQPPYQEVPLDYQNHRF